MWAERKRLELRNPNLQQLDWGWITNAPRCPTSIFGLAGEKPACIHNSLRNITQLQFERLYSFVRGEKNKKVNRSIPGYSQFLKWVTWTSQIFHLWSGTAKTASRCVPMFKDHGKNTARQMNLFLCFNSRGQPLLRKISEVLHHPPVHSVCAAGAHYWSLITYEAGKNTWHVLCSPSCLKTPGLHLPLSVSNRWVIKAFWVQPLRHNKPLTRADWRQRIERHPLCTCHHSKISIRPSDLVRDNRRWNIVDLDSIHVMSNLQIPQPARQSSAMRH